MNGQSIATADDIHRRLTGQPPGVSITLTLLRGGEKRELQVVPGET